MAKRFLRNLAIMVAASSGISGCAVAIATTAVYTSHGVQEYAKTPRFQTRINGTRIEVITFLNSCSYGSFVGSNDTQPGKNAQCGLIRFPVGSSFTLEERLVFAKQMVASEPRIDWAPIPDKKLFERYNTGKSTKSRAKRQFYFPYIAKDRPAKWRFLQAK